MDTKCVCKGICDICPPTPRPTTLNNHLIERQISTKMRVSQLLKIKGIFSSGNKHTANLPGTKRSINPIRT